MSSGVPFEVVYLKLPVIIAEVCQVSQSGLPRAPGMPDAMVSTTCTHGPAAKCEVYTGHITTLTIIEFRGRGRASHSPYISCLECLYCNLSC
jgi:hypothetical protein